LLASTAGKTHRQVDSDSTGKCHVKGVHLGPLTLRSSISNS
jgi:hypothetical protein